VDFYADWCGPCQLMARILEQVHAQLQDKIRIVKIDTEKYTELASQYQIYALPTLILFKQGKPVDKIEGVLQPADLVRHLESLLR
jgi:thioredoxin